VTYNITEGRKFSSGDGRRLKNGAVKINPYVGWNPRLKTVKECGMVKNSAASCDRSIK